ncbi:MAG TPA: ATP-dependent DNA ligase [Nitriliruptorales bacterium]|nr:ATP-dependent DNA ligase [Nitriliruptorales bacterium]
MLTARTLVGMLLVELVSTVEEVAATRSRRRKVELLAACLRAMTAEAVAVGASWLAGAPRQPRLEVGWATLREVSPPPAERPSLTLLDADRRLENLAAIHGVGSRSARLDALTQLLGRGTPPEQRFLRQLVAGELRQGALEGIVTQAVARAFDVADPDVRRALMLRGDLGAVAETARRGGSAGIRAIRLTLFQPLQPMLAQTADDLDEALADLGPAAVEAKLDGARVQAHRLGDEVRVYTRNLREVTDRLGAVVEAVRGLPAGRLVLDGEVLALRHDGRPRAFQDTMRRFGTDPLPERLTDLTLTPFWFDVLHLDGDDLLDRPLAERTAALEEAVPEPRRVPRRTVVSPDDARAGLDEALRRGHEGVMLKALDAPYAAGRRGAAWRKVKPVHTLDLVVLAAEWGSGRRRGWLSNLHLGARDPASGAFVMLGKTFKGLTDALLRWQTERLLELEVAREGHVVHVRPELVVEVAFDGVQASSRYPGGVTLRFARVKRYRPDLRVEEADTIDTVRAVHVRR